MWAESGVDTGIQKRGQERVRVRACVWVYSVHVHICPRVCVCSPGSPGLSWDGQRGPQSGQCSHSPSRAGLGGHAPRGLGRSVPTARERPDTAVGVGEGKEISRSKIISPRGVSGPALKRSPGAGAGATWGQCQLGHPSTGPWAPLPIETFPRAPPSLPHRAPVTKARSSVHAWCRAIRSSK